MEKPLFHVSARGGNSIDELAFYGDRLEHEWKRPPTANGKSVYLRQALSPYISSQRTFGWGASSSFRSFGWYLGIGLILHVGFEKPLLQLVGILFYVVALGLFIHGLTQLKREEWLYIARRDGAAVVTLRARGIEGWTPEEFRQKYVDYVREDLPAHPTTHQAMIQIVPFNSHQVDDVGALIVGIQRDEFQIPITLEDQPDLQDIPAFYQQGTGNFWVAVSESEVVGTVALLDIGNHQGALRKMFVHAGYRGSGHGVSARLLDTLLEWSRARGVKEIYLGTTEKFLAAHRFYERNGFEQIAANELPSSFPRMALDTRFYRRALQSTVAESEHR